MFPEAKAYSSQERDGRQVGNMENRIEGAVARKRIALRISNMANFAQSREILPFWVNRYTGKMKEVRY